MRGLLIILQQIQPFTPDSAIISTLIADYMQTIASEIAFSVQI